VSERRLDSERATLARSPTALSGIGAILILINLLAKQKKAIPEAGRDKISHRVRAINFSSRRTKREKFSLILKFFFYFSAQREQARRYEVLSVTLLNFIVFERAEASSPPPRHTLTYRGVAGNTTAQRGNIS
jgi:hypothetical protein